MKKRILQLTGSFLNGGTERQAAALAVGLKRDGKYDVHIATLNREGILLDGVQAAGFSAVPEFPLTSFFNANFVKQVRRFSAYLRNERIDLIHTHDFYTNVFGMAAATLARTEAKVASKREIAEMRTKAQDVVEKIAFGRADRIVANSNAVRDRLTQRGIDIKKAEVIYNGLDLDRFGSPLDIKTHYGIPADAKIITLVANLRHEVKNLPMFLAVAKVVSATIADAHFVIAGEGELENDLRSMAAALGVDDRVHFIGRCDDVPALLSSSFAGVLTSRAEGFSNSIIEYMAAGKPVVATNVGGAAEAIVEGETGYLVPSDDPEGMAASLIQLLEDSAKADAFGKAGREVAQRRFSRDSQIARTTALYDSLLTD